jgi:hypothetical protein
MTEKYGMMLNIPLCKNIKQKDCKHDTTWCGKSNNFDTICMFCGKVIKKHKVIKNDCY